MSARTPRLRGRSGDRPWIRERLKEMDVDLLAAMCFIAARSASHAIKLLLLLLLLKIINNNISFFFQGKLLTLHVSRCLEKS